MTSSTDAATRADAARARIAASPHAHAFVTLSDEQGDGPLVAVKDLIDVRGLPTTGGGPRTGVPLAERDAPAIAGLRQAGAVVIGKANLYEWGYGVASDNVHHGDVVNPRDPSRSAGGSSSGSAAAVAAGLCDWSVGTDTAGSIRIPASLCGIVGFKPTTGVVSTEGAIALSPTQDTLGVLAPSVDVAWAAACALGVPAGDSSPAPEWPRLAVPEGWVDDLEPAVEDAWARVAAGLRPIAFPSRQELFDAATTVQAFEAQRLHREALARSPERYRPEVSERIARGARIPRTAYEEARATLARLAAAADRACAGVDALLLPTTACVAPPLTAPEQREPLTRFTRPFNATGQPAFSLPLPGEDLPVGLQVVGRRGRDAELAAVARALERRVADGSA